MRFSVSQNRIYIIFAFFAFIIFIVLAKQLYVQIIDAESNRKAAVESRTISYNTPPKRGTIYDRNGNILAYSKEAKTIYANPSEIDNPHQTAVVIAKNLGGSSEDFEDSISDHNKKFAYIKRRVEVDVAQKLKDEQLKGIYFQEDQKREYPYGKVAGQVIGAINIDGDGLCGIELYYDDILRGSTGKTVRQQGMKGMPIPGGTLQETAVIDGQDIMLSIDIELQERMEAYLEEWNGKIGCKSMHSILIDPTNGEIYAAASLPLFNPADMASAEEGSTDLRCISGLYEPGSTFKTIAATAIMEYGAMTPETEVFCPATLAADEYTISDVHERGSTTYTFRQIMEQSSNVGISLSTERLGFDKYYDKIIKYKLNDNTGIDYPGDASGYLLDLKDWSQINAYNISFGQGITTTPLQISRFYGALANNGIEETPHFLMRYLQAEKDETYPEYDVIDNKQAIPIVNDILRSVVTNGTGALANIPGYGVAGKTGTAEIADSNGKYISGAYYSSFVGFLSQANIPMLCLVGGDRAPSDSTVTMVFKDIMMSAIERLKIIGKG